MNSATERAVLTIGHSTHSIEAFLRLLEAHGVLAVADVRSVPYSHRQPQFSRDALRRALEERGIGYDFRGAELGARSEDRSCYENGRVQYRRVAGMALFQSGLDLVVEEARERRVVLLCAEKEPLDCHRTLLVARELENRDVSVSHIHADGRVETHGEVLTRLLKELNMPEVNFFQTREQVIEEAYARQEDRIAYVVPRAQREPEERAG